MDFKEYQVKAAHSANKDPVWREQVFNFSLGLCGESGEVAEKVKKLLFHGQVSSREEIAAELGDCLWYLSQLARLFNLGLDEIAELNIQKLRKRYPHGFRSKEQKEFNT